jgi:hypothetical protein
MIASTRCLSSLLNTFCLSSNLRLILTYSAFIYLYDFISPLHSSLLIYFSNLFLFLSVSSYFSPLFHF